MKEEFDLVVIGTGSGGVSVANKCVSAGWNVAIVDSSDYGGTCALRGCDPKKMFIAVTEGIDISGRMKDNGLQSAELHIDWKKMLTFKRTFTDKVPASTEDWLKNSGVTTLHGEARFIEQGVLQVGERELHAKHFHIATGARPMTLGFEGEDWLTSSTDFLALESIPSRIVFVGGGFIAFEFAHIVKRAGASEVTILEMGQRPLINFDPDLVELEIERSKELGIDIRLESRVEKITRPGDEFQVTFSTPQGTVNIACDLVVHGAGRVPNIDMLNLETIGVETGRRGIKVNKFMHSTSNATIFSAGDCADTGAPNLTPVSASEARIVAKNLLAGEDEFSIDYPPIPSAVFTLPPMATIGLLEDDANKQNIEFDVKFGKTGDWYSSVRVGERYSAYKILIEKNTGKIIGAHLLGPGSEEQINVLSIAMKAGMTANQLKGVIFAYPSYASDLSYMV